MQHAKCIYIYMMLENSCFVLGLYVSTMDTNEGLWMFVVYLSMVSGVFAPTNIPAGFVPLHHSDE